MTMLMLTGDVNLMKVTDAAVPFGLVGDELRTADVIFSNLECLLYTAPPGHSVSNEGFFADPAIGGAFHEVKKGQKPAGRQAEFESRWDQTALSNYTEARTLAERALAAK